MSESKIVVTGGAGLVGQNLVPRLKSCGFKNIVVIDKHSRNLKILKSLEPDITVVEADLSTTDLSWSEFFKDCDTLVQLHAQIGGKNHSEFIANNITATKNVMAVAKREGVNRVIHVSSSVINSRANDFYTQSKSQQEQLVLDMALNTVVLRPTLMFGWFDRKHLGWLSRFMKRTPIFPIPGTGKYIRQPLFAGDFCQIITACINNHSIRGTYDISGLENVFYVDIIRAIKTTTKSRTILCRIPFSIFYFLLKVWSIFDRNPPFTTDQLKALVIPESFRTDDWPTIFGVTPTEFDDAIEKTFNHPEFSSVTLEF